MTSKKLSYENLHKKMPRLLEAEANGAFGLAVMPTDSCRFHSGEVSAIFVSSQLLILSFVGVFDINEKPFTDYTVKGLSTNSSLSCKASCLLSTVLRKSKDAAIESKKVWRRTDTQPFG